jgi:hypothetical protein
MANLKQELHHFEQLSQDLVRFFMLSSAFGVMLSKRIILYGCPMDVLIPMADVMRKQLIDREDVTISILEQSSIPLIASDSYYIDIGYFVAHASRAELFGLYASRPSFAQDVAQQISRNSILA